MTDSGHSYNNRSPDETRTGNWMQTFTGRQFWPLDPRPEEIDLEDIATGLSRACRYAGHCERFYSVAEHSVLVSHVVPPSLALKGLLHDATEAYLVDIPRPIKPALTGYMAIEQRLWEAVAVRFGLSPEMPDAIKAADNAVLLAESTQIMKPHPAPWCVPGEPAAVRILCFPPEEARLLFLARFEELTGQVVL